jgi:hypothetical protein
MKKLNIFKTLGLSMVIFTSNAQDYSADGFRFSQLVNPAGSSRMRALGGEYTAIGADVSNISGNPAGLGLYTRSEFSVSGGLNSLTTSANYIDKQSSSKSNFGLNNLAMVFGGKNGNSAYSQTGWKTGNFGISYNRNSNLFNNFSFGGLNKRSSIADSYVEQVNGNKNNTGAFLDSKEQFNPDTRVARSAEAMYYQMYLIEPDAKGGVPYKRFDYTNPASGVDQQGSFQSEGKTGQWTFAYGANYNDKLYIGVSGGIASLNYDFTNSQTDRFVGGKFINSLTSNQLLAVEGKGVNVTGGLIFRPNNMVRIGATIHTPTWYSITESYDQNLSVVVNPSNTANIPTDLRSVSVASSDFDYELRTPLRGSVGMAVFLGKKGFITADAEYVGYNKMRLTASTLSPTDNAAFTKDNSKFINQDYKNVVNLKVGGEIRAGAVNLRAGVAYMADPYKIKYDNINRDRLAISTGLGYKTNSFYVDLAGSYTTYKSAFNPYTLNNPADYASAKLDIKNTNLSFTLGTYF